MARPTKAQLDLAIDVEALIVEQAPHVLHAADNVDQRQGIKFAHPRHRRLGFPRCV